MDQISSETTFKKLHFNTTQIIILTFLSTILIGALLLMLPVSTATGEWCPFLSALFTSTTSVCVTGLIEQNAGKYTQAVIADLSDTDAIRELGLGSMDAVIITMAQDLEASIMCVMVAKECGVHRIVAKAGSKRKGEILKKIGATQIVFPERESGARTAFQLMSRDIMQFFDLSSDLVFVELEPRKEWDGKTISELNLRTRYGINVVAVRVGEKVQPVTDLNMVIHRKEPLLVVISKDKMEELRG